MMQPDLFAATSAPLNQGMVTIDVGAVLQGALALPLEHELIAAIGSVTRVAPFRHMLTRRGGTLSVAMSNCGELGWLSDRRGYRYDPLDPESGQHWQKLPPVFADLARRAAQNAGFADFAPDVCLINRYRPGNRLGLHRDMDEGEFRSPIVSVSLGLPAVFLWGGRTRAERPRRIPLSHGDVVVWGGPARMNFHGVALVAEGNHPLTGGLRYNLTFRRARCS
jgi:DNA oxidative demethylase